jgi:hypothetical protein
LAWNGYRGVVAKKSAELTPPSATGKTEAYPGQRFGLPKRGPGSVASMPRRLLALLIDWLLCMVIAYGLLGSQFWTIAVFAVEVFMLTALTGSWSLLRTAILLTVIPPLLADRDLRGLHDRASDTIVVRM